MIPGNKINATHISLFYRALRSLRVLPLVILSLLAADVFAGPELYGADLKIGPVVKQSDRIFLSFRIVAYPKNDIVEAIRRGIVVKISYEVEVIKGSLIDFFVKDTVVRRRIKRSVKYDYWNKAFLIEEGRKKTICHNEEAMFRAFFEVQDMEMILPAISEGDRYYLRYRAVLKSVDMYFPMNYIFKYIVGIWDFDTGWIKGPSLDEVR